MALYRLSLHRRNKEDDSWQATQHGHETGDRGIPGQGEDHRQIPAAVAIRWKPRRDMCATLPKSQIGVDPGATTLTMKYITIRGPGRYSGAHPQGSQERGPSSISQPTLTAREKPFPGIWRTRAGSSTRRKPCRIEFHEITKKAVKDAHQTPAGHRHGSGGRAAGAPRPGPSGGLQDQPASLGEGEEGPVCRPRAERSHAVWWWIGSGRSKRLSRGVLGCYRAASKRQTPEGTQGQLRREVWCCLDGEKARYSQRSGRA